jgi:excisionase family DNA binding protein
MENMLTINEVAKRLGLCRHTVRRLIESNELRAFHIRRQWRVSEIDLQDFLDATRT